MGIKSDIDDAIKVHGAWKAKFRDFLSGKAGMEMAEISHSDSCKLGMWLGEAGQRMLSPAHHTKTCELHEKFHQVAGGIVQNIKQKDFEAARQALSSGGDFDQASHELCAFLLKVSMHGAPKQEAKVGTANAASEDGAQSTIGAPEKIDAVAATSAPA